MKRHLHLLMIDPQNDFCDLPAAYLADGQHAPALQVAEAHADMQRVACKSPRPPMSCQTCWRTGVVEHASFISTVNTSSQESKEK